MQAKWETAEELNLALARRFVLIRKRKGISGKTLSALSGVSYGSLRRFEQTGQISLLSLTRLAMALNCEDEIRNLFKDIPYSNMKEIENEKR